MLLFNQKYWGKFHRNEWLTKDNRNSKFVYRCVKTRKQKNSIRRINDESAVWLDDKSLIEKKIITDYSSSFKSQKDNLRQPMSINMPRMVYAEENDLLTLAIIPQEIKDAVFEMDSSKAPGPDRFGARFF